MTSSRRHDVARLRDLVGPLSVDAFIDGYWLPGRPHLGQADAALLDAIRAIDGLQSPEELVARHRRNVRVFGPNGERDTVPPDQGIDWLRRGHTLYVDYVHRTVPEAHQLMCGVAADMGVEPWQLTLEAFAGTAGSVSTRHFDHDVTIQILLAGEKDWIFEPNENITNPLHPYHPPLSSDEKLAAFSEEVYSHRQGTVAGGVDASNAMHLGAQPGSTVFLARGWWHTTHSRTDTWSVNVVFHSVSWARALGRALEIRLHADPMFRAYCGGFAQMTRTPTDLEAQQAAATMSALQRAASGALDDMSSAEVPLAMLGFIGRLFRWSHAAVSRRLVLVDHGWQLSIGGDMDHTLPVADHIVEPLAALCRVTSNFRWDHIPPLLDGVDAGEFYDVMAQLVDAGAIDVVHPGLGT